MSVCVLCPNGCTYVHCGDSPVWLFQEFPPPPEYANVPMPGKMQSSTVVAQLLGLFLFNSVPLRTQMCLCVLNPHLFVRLLVAR